MRAKFGFYASYKGKEPLSGTFSILESVPTVAAKKACELELEVPKKDVGFLNGLIGLVGSENATTAAGDRIEHGDVSLGDDTAKLVLTVPLAKLAHRDIAQPKLSNVTQDITRRFIADFASLIEKDHQVVHRGGGVAMR